MVNKSDYQNNLNYIFYVFIYTVYSQLFVSRLSVVFLRNHLHFTHIRIKSVKNYKI